MWTVIVGYALVLMVLPWLLLLLPLLFQAFGGHPEGRRDEMLVEVDLSAIVADMEDGGGAGGGDHHGDGQVVVTYGSQDPYEIVRTCSIGLSFYVSPAHLILCSYFVKTLY